MPANCRSCRYFATGDDNRTEQYDHWRMECRRHAPTFIQITTERQCNPEGVWPHMRGDGWCGDYEEYVSRDAR